MITKEHINLFKNSNSIALIGTGGNLAIAQHMASDIYRHTGKFTPHKGASLVAKFKVQKLHKK